MSQKRDKVSNLKICEKFHLELGRRRRWLDRPSSLLPHPPAAPGDRTALGALARGGEPGVTRFARRRGIRIDGPCVPSQFRQFGALGARGERRSVHRYVKHPAGPVSREGHLVCPSSLSFEGRAPTSPFSLFLSPCLRLPRSLSLPVLVSLPKDVGPGLPSGITGEYPKVSKPRTGAVRTTISIVSRIREIARVPLG